MSPLVSVIIPTYNRSDLVCRAVASVLAQTYRELECIVVSDRSTDNTLDALTSLMLTDARLVVVSHLENRHVSAARNTGLLLANGRLIAFLDDDDCWLADKLRLQVASLMAAAPNVGLIYCWMDIYDSQKKIGTRRPILKGHLFDQLIESQPLGNASTFLVKNEVVQLIGGFDESLPRGNDGDFIRRASLHFKIEVVPQVLVHYFVDHGGSSRITDSGYIGVINGIRGHEAKLGKFQNELKTRQNAHAGLLATIATQYALVGDLRSAKNYLARAFRLRPVSIIVWLAIPRVFLNYFVRRVDAPLSDT